MAKKKSPRKRARGFTRRVQQLDGLSSRLQRQMAEAPARSPVRVSTGRGVSHFELRQGAHEREEPRGPVAPPPVGRLGEAMQCLQRELVALTTTIDELEARLSVALMPSPPETSQAVAESPTRSPLIGSLFIDADDLARQRIRIESLLARLEL